MHLADFIQSNKDEIIERWRETAVAKLSLDLEKSQLLNDLPEFLDDVADVLRVRGKEWPHIESAERHGRQRMRIGVDVGSLVEEMTTVAQAITEVARSTGKDLEHDDLLNLVGIIGRGAGVSANAYAELRDKQLADQAARHFSFIAHEIRNPLHTAQIAAQVLTSAPEAEREQCRKRLSRSLSKLADLVDDALIEARLYGEPRLDIQDIDSRELVEQVCDDLADQLAERNQRVETSVENFSFRADRTLVESALSNLLRNAVKFTRDGRRIAVESRRENEQVVFSVLDQCGGIPDHIRSRLFEPFVQARSRKGGSGLGLLIVKQAVEAHDGEVTVETPVGEGCRFSIRLPLRQNK